MKCGRHVSPWTGQFPAKTKRRGRGQAWLDPLLSESGKFRTVKALGAQARATRCLYQRFFTSYSRGFTTMAIVSGCWD